MASGPRDLSIEASRVSRAVRAGGLTESSAFGNFGEGLQAVMD